MALNITRNRRGNQPGQALRRRVARSDLPSYVGSADGHQGQLEGQNRVRKPDMKVKSGLSPCGTCAVCYANYSYFQQGLPAMPAFQCRKLVSANDQVELAARIFDLQGLQRINSEARPCAFELPIIDQDPLQRAKRQPRHGQAVFGRAKGPGLVPGLPGGDDVQGIELQLRHCRTGQRNVGLVRRVKRTTEHADSSGAGGDFAQSQSRRIKNSLCRRSSAEPASVGRW